MQNTRRKALYIFLSSVLGMLLLTMFHRAVFVIYDILAIFYPNCQWLHLPPAIVFSLDFLTLLIALFIGGWYGVWLGLNWHTTVYEERGVTTWFHGFVPHSWRKTSKKSGDSFIDEVLLKTTSKAVPKKIVVTATSAKSSALDNFKTFRASKPPLPSFLEEVINSKKTTGANGDTEKPVRRVVRKKPAAKTIRKSSSKS